MRINLIWCLVNPGDQALISISTILKISALIAYSEYPVWKLKFFFNLLLLDITFPTSCNKDKFDYKYRYDATSNQLIFH